MSTDNLTLADVTPQWLARIMVGIANVQADHRVLEPCAGTGTIPKILSEYTDKKNIHCLELNKQRYESLALKFPNVTRKDMFLYSPYDDEKLARESDYHSVIFNPPFKDRLYEKFPMKAYEFLRYGGRSVSLIMRNASRHEHGHVYSDEFQDFLDRKNARLYPLNQNFTMNGEIWPVDILEVRRGG